MDADEEPSSPVLFKRRRLATSSVAAESTSPSPPSRVDVVRRRRVDVARVDIPDMARYWTMPISVLRQICWDTTGDTDDPSQLCLDIAIIIAQRRILIGKACR